MIYLGVTFFLLPRRVCPKVMKLYMQSLSYILHSQSSTLHSSHCILHLSSLYQRSESDIKETLLASIFIIISLVALRKNGGQEEYVWICCNCLHAFYSSTHHIVNEQKHIGFCFLIQLYKRIDGMHLILLFYFEYIGTRDKRVKKKTIYFLHVWFLTIFHTRRSSSLFQSSWQWGSTILRLVSKISPQCPPPLLLSSKLCP